MSNKTKHILVILIAFLPIAYLTISSAMQNNHTFFEALQLSAVIIFIFGFFLYVFTLITFQMFFGLKVRKSHVNEEEKNSTKE
ncbi:MAG: hypothetical protein HRT41_00715 [Campylobacteraceae bacterium]|nr:hypothetical protein [Campylobacteraceae bacterium]